MTISELTLTSSDPEPVRRFEVFTGSGRRRDWPPEEKARIVAESYEAGETVSGVARRYALSPQQVFTWRREARRRAVASEAAAPAFVPAVVVLPAPEPAAKRLPRQRGRRGRRRDRARDRWHRHAARSARLERRDLILAEQVELAFEERFHIVTEGFVEVYARSFTSDQMRKIIETVRQYGPDGAEAEAALAPLTQSPSSVAMLQHVVREWWNESLPSAFEKATVRLASEGITLKITDEGLVVFR